MRTAANALVVTGWPLAGAGFERIAPAKSRAVKVVRVAMNVALFCAAPFVALGYVVAFPLVGLAMLAWMGVRSLLKRADKPAVFLKNAGLFLAAPFVGLAYAVALPFVGAVLLAWWGVRAAVKRARAR